MDAGWGWMVCVAWRLGNGEGGGVGLGWVGWDRRVAKRGEDGRDTSEGKRGEVGMDCWIGAVAGGEILMIDLGLMIGLD